METVTPTTSTPKKELTINLNSHTFFTALLVLLIVVSAIQMVQLFALQRTVATGIFSTPAANAAAPQSGGAVPQMVGGC